jgi:hypothetical protein
MANSKTSELKKKFVTGATPTETDYQDLINLADVGRKAVGVPDGEGDPKPGDGLDYYSKDGKLSVKRKEHSGLTVSDTGLGVKPGIGVQLGENTVKLAIKEESALSTEGGVLHIKTGNGVMKLAGQLTLNVNNSQGLSTDNGKLQVNFDPNTVKADNCRLAVKYDGDYFTVDEAKGLRLLPKWFEKLASEFSGALNKAILGTSGGSNPNSNSDPSKLEQEIAAALQSAYAAGQLVGFTKPPELAKIIRDGLIYLEQEASDAAISQLQIDEDRPTKVDRKLVLAQQLWSSWLRQAWAAAGVRVVKITYPQEAVLPLRSGMNGAYRIDVDDDDIIDAEAGTDVVKLRPVGIGRTTVTPRREIRALGRRVVVPDEPVAIEVAHPSFLQPECWATSNGRPVKLSAREAGTGTTYAIPEGEVLTGKVTGVSVVFERQGPGEDGAGGLGQKPRAEGAWAQLGGRTYEAAGRIAGGGMRVYGTRRYRADGAVGTQLVVDVVYYDEADRVLPGKITVKVGGALWAIRFA